MICLAGYPGNFGKHLSISIGFLKIFDFIRYLIFFVLHIFPCNIPSALSSLFHFISPVCIPICHPSTLVCIMCLGLKFTHCLTAWIGLVLQLLPMCLSSLYSTLSCLQREELVFFLPSGHIPALQEPGTKLITIKWTISQSMVTYWAN